VNSRTTISKYDVTSWPGRHLANNRVQMESVPLVTDMVSRTLRNRTKCTACTSRNRMLVSLMRRSPLNCPTQKYLYDRVRDLYCMIYLVFVYRFLTCTSLYFAFVSVPVCLARLFERGTLLVFHYLFLRSGTITNSLGIVRVVRTTSYIFAINCKLKISIEY
jgi:hypothetical protein